MANNFQSTTTSKAQSFGKGMMKDTTDIYMTDGLWYNAINAINNSHLGEVGSIGNEQSNQYCTASTYDIIGFAHYKDKKWLLFTTDDKNSEIGIFDESDCSYSVVVAASEGVCLGFKKTHMITSQIKENYDCSFSAYWQDGLNPDRTMNIENPPFKLKAKTNVCDPDVIDTPRILDCEKIRLNPLVKQPCLTIKKAEGSGQLNNGSYMAVVAYSSDGLKLTDYSTPTQPQGLWQDSGIGGGLEVNLSNLDDDYEEYELVIIAVIGQQAIAKKIGYYSTNQTKVTVDVISASLETVPLNNIPLQTLIYEKSDKMFSVNNYLIRTGVTSQPYLNYQKLANQIAVEWVAVEYDKQYYWNGGNNVGYMRDEVYSFFIRWVYNTGSKTASYHIPGRASIPSDLTTVATPDVVDSTQNKNWQVYDTSTGGPVNGATLPDGGIIKAKGSMAYWESTERYPANQDIWGTLCNTPIRHHKMPSNETHHIHDKTGEKIYVLGVDFSNIAHPVDSNNNPIPDIVGYEILRGSREGNKTIVSKGIFSNMLEFNINGKGTKKKGLLANYPYNDLRPDPFLSDDYTILDNNVNTGAWDSSSQLSNYKQDYLAFSSIETHFLRPALGGNHIKIYTEEIGTSTGSFKIPYKHPRFKFLTDASLGLGLFIGLGLAVVDVLGRTTVEGGNNIVAAPFGAGAEFNAKATRSGGEGSIFSDLIGGGVLSAVSAGGQFFITGATVGAGLLIAGLSYYLPKGMNAVFDIIKNLTNYRDFCLQYDSHGFYNNYLPVSNSASGSAPPSFSRAVAPNMGRYVGMHVQDFDSTYRINNWNRGKFICLKLTSNLPNPITVDDSKKTIKNVSGLTHQSPFNEFTSQIVQYYGAIKVDYQNQYGQLDSIIQLPVESCIKESLSTTSGTRTSGVLFGGDTYINRYTEKNPYYFFNTWMMGEPDGYNFDYRAYVNGPAPRYYAAYWDYDASDFNIKINFVWAMPPFTFTINSPSDYYRFDQGPSVKSGILVKKDAWFYLFYNGVREYYTESEFNIAFRDYGEDDTQKFYDVHGYSFNNLDVMFRSDLITKPVYFKYDLSLSTARLFNNFKSFGYMLPRSYDPKVYSTCFEYQPYRAIYSLQQQSGMRRDNWKNFLPANVKDFPGKINAIKPLNASGAIMLFNSNEPVYFPGVDQLQTNGGVKVTIGDGGLFQGTSQSLANADDAFAYGSSISSRATINTPYGMFFVSQQQGKIFQSNGQSLEEISRVGMKHWFAEYLPSKLLQMYPDFPLYDNPVAGIAVQAIFDSTYELIYFTKRDYIPLRTDFKFDDPSGVPYIGGAVTQVLPPAPPEHTYNGNAKCNFMLVSQSNEIESGNGVTLKWTTTDVVSVVFEPNIVNNPTMLNGEVTVYPSESTTYILKGYDADNNYTQCFIQITVKSSATKTFTPFTDAKYFTPCNWTVSYDPKNKMWISFHSWEPTLLMPSSTHFFTIKGKSIWKHNELNNSYCNYYGKNYQWEIEFPIVTPNQVTTLKSFEYYLDVYKFVNDDRDFVHILDENFDRAIIYNTEQISGWLVLKPKLKNDPLSIIAQRKLTSQGFEIYFSKEENKYRFNQFWDITDNRGEFISPSPVEPMWKTDCSGYKKVANAKYMDFNKPPTQCKKFRHYGNTVIFSKSISNDLKMLFKLSNVKLNQSPR